MTIAKGRPWGAPAPLPAEGVIVGSDADARRVLEQARRGGGPVPAIGLLGGDLCRTLGGGRNPSRLRSASAVTFPVDVGSVRADGHQHWFVAHLVAHDRWWRHVVVVMNAQWRNGWNLGPRAHPNDGLVDIYEADLRLADLAKLRRRLPSGTHLPHPRVAERRTGAARLALPRGCRVWLDGSLVGTAQTLTVEVEPDALTVVV